MFRISEASTSWTASSSRAAAVICRNFKVTGDDIEIADEDAAVHALLEPAQLFEINEIHRVLRDSIDILVQFVIDDELPKLFEVGVNFSCIITIIFSFRIIDCAVYYIPPICIPSFAIYSSSSS